MCAEWPAAHDAKQPHPAATPQSVTGDGFIGVFGTGWQMPAGIADKGRECHLIESHECRTQHSSWRLAPGIGKVPAIAFGRSLARMIFAARTHQAALAFSSI